MLLPSEPEPPPGGLGHTVHIALLGVLLKLQNFLLAHHVPSLHGFLQVADTGQSIICGVILVPDEPAAAASGCDQLAVGGVLQVPGVIHIKTLEPPKLIALHHITGHLPEQRVHMAEPLGGIVKRYVIVAAGQDGIQEQRVNIGFEVTAVHLDTELVPQNQGNCQGIVLIVVFPVPFCGKDNLLQADELLI